MQGKWIVMKDVMKNQKELVLESKTHEVIDNIKAQGGKSDAADKLINYYLVNTARMDYKLYKSIDAGIMVSGAIESTHRTVIQKRMKQSGQRWTIKGAQNMLNLRVLQMKGQWGKVAQLIRNAAQPAATIFKCTSNDPFIFSPLFLFKF